MENAITAHAILLMVTTTVTVTIFLGLAIYVVTRNPRQHISWVFSLLCLTIATIYLSSLFMVVRPDPSPTLAHFFLRWKWVAITFSATLYLHFVFFYFPPNWRLHRYWILIPTYVISIGLASVILFTNFILVDHLHYPAPHIITPASDPLIYLISGFFMLQVVGGAVGLAKSYSLAPSLPLRRQIFYLLVPTGLVLFGSTVYWLTILTESGDTIPHEIPDIFLILAAFFYVQAVIRYGSFVGHPLAKRSVFYTILSITVGLIVFSLAISLDKWLMPYTAYPYPVTMGIMVFLFAVGYPTINYWVKRYLDQRLFRAERQQQELVTHLANALAESPDPEQLQAELLSSLCAILGVQNGYIALSTPNLPPEQLVVQIVQGNLALQPGNIIERPPLHSKDAQLITVTLSLQTQTEAPLQNIALLCPLIIDQTINGILAIGEKHNNRPFSYEEVVLCTNLAKQLNAVGHMIHLREQRNQYLEAAYLQEETLQDLGKQVVTSTHRTLTAWADREVPLEIRILGPFQVFRNGELVSEAAWGSEKAKGLLAYLLWKSPDGATRAEISQILWPDRPFEETANVFHVTLHRLRRVLQPERSRKQTGEYIPCKRKHYFFNTKLPHGLDVTAFQQYLESRNPDLQAAIHLYRGPYLEDLAWALPPEAEIQRRQLEQTYADTLRRIAAQTNGREAVSYLEKLLVVEPSDETVHEALVLGYLARGRRDLARQQMNRWQQTLIEFGYEASPETRVLWQKIEGN